MTNPGVPARRILFDISTSIRWIGPPAGISRVERQFASWAAAHIHGVEFVSFDPTDLVYRRLAGDAGRFLSGDAAVDTFGLPDPARSRRHRTDRIPDALRSAFFWCTQTRRMILQKLELMRLRSRRPGVSAFLDRAQLWLMSDKYRAVMVRKDGTRRPFYPYAIVAGDPVDFQSDDVLVCVGSGWGNTNINVIANLKSRTGFRMVLLCHDLIPIMFPEFYREHDVRIFSNYMRQALAIADRIFVTSRAIEADCRSYCRQQGIEPKEIVVGFLGADILPANSQGSGILPAQLIPNRFVLLVATIEPRKGHALLCQVWRRLIKDGIPQSKGIKLVFVGRQGWMVEELIATIRRDEKLGEQIVMLPEVSDRTLEALYRNAAFCVYPSRYEGYGLPIVEAFQYGKPVLASSGGALPELTRDFSPSIDATDEDAWYRSLKSWLLNPSEYRAYTERLRTEFRHPPWSAAAKKFFEGLAEDC